MSKFKINNAGLRNLEKDLKKKLSADVPVPTTGSESDATDSVKKQLKKMGVTPNDAEVRRIVRGTRKD